MMSDLLVDVPRRLPHDASRSNLRGGERDARDFGARTTDAWRGASLARRHVRKRPSDVGVDEPRAAKGPPRSVLRVNEHPERPERAHVRDLSERPKIEARRRI